MKTKVFVLGIAGPSGSGKSTSVNKVAALLEDSDTMFYDDYRPNYDKLTEDLGELRKGNPITYPKKKRIIQPKKYIVIEEPKPDYRTGIGTDIHELVTGRRLMLGGVYIKCPVGLLGHSDGDVALHAIIDALLGAAGLGDIGTWFPDTDEQWEHINALENALRKFVPVWTTIVLMVGSALTGSALTFAGMIIKFANSK